MPCVQLNTRVQVHFRLCYPGYYPVARPRSPEATRRIFTMSVEVSTASKRRRNDNWLSTIQMCASNWELDFNLISDVVWHRQEQDCHHCAYFAGNIHLGESQTLCLHFLTLYEALLLVHPCGVKYGEAGRFPFIVTPKQRRQMVTVERGVRLTMRMLFDRFLQPWNIPASEVAGYEYHLESEECDTARPIPKRFVPPGWDSPIHVHIRLRSEQAFMGVMVAEDALAKPTAVKILDVMGMGMREGEDASWYENRNVLLQTTVDKVRRGEYRDFYGNSVAQLIDASCDKMKEDLQDACVEQAVMPKSEENEVARDYERLMGELVQDLQAARLASQG